MAHRYYFKISVKGRGEFPLDQLRRFEMFPITVDAVRLMECSFNNDMATRTIELGMYASSLSADNNCLARFRSFGWIGETLEIWKDDELFEQNGEVVALAVERETRLKLESGLDWENRS